MNHVATDSLKYFTENLELGN